MAEITGQQLIVVASAGEIRQTLPATYRTYRTMRTHPTIAMARALTTAPVLAGAWSVEAKDGVSDEWVKDVDDAMIALRDDVVPPSMLYGSCDFGWMPFEIVWTLSENGGARPTFKALLHDITTIMVEPSGPFAGFKQRGQAGDVVVPVEQALCVSFRVEGTDWHGQPLMENARRAYVSWLAGDEGAARYDQKIAGSHWVIKYPVGTTEIDGVKVDNAVTAKAVLASLQSSGSVVIPKKVAKQVASLNELSVQQSAWEINLESDKTARQASFADRLGYLDKTIVRAFLAPERALTEGRYGTKAEAGDHIELALLQRELEHKTITRQVNKQVVDRMLAANWGPEAAGKVWLVAAPLTDDKRTLLKEVLIAAIQTDVGPAWLDTIDVDALYDALGLPKAQQIAIVEGDAEIDPDTMDVEDDEEEE